MTGWLAPAEAVLCKPPQWLKTQSRKAFGLLPFLPYPLQLCWCCFSIPCIKPACPVTLPAMPNSAAVQPGGVADPAGPVWTLGPQARPSPSVGLSEAHQVLVTCSQQRRAKHTAGCPACLGTHAASIILLKASEITGCFSGGKCSLWQKTPGTCKQIICFNNFEVYYQVIFPMLIFSH